MSNHLAIQAYRQSLRATKVAFRSDIPVLTAARAQIREGFEKNKSIQDAEQAAEEIKKLNDVSTFLIKNVVQGEKQDKDDRYYLNFHDKIELGDNETIKQGKQNMGSLAGVKAKKRPQ